MGQFTEHSDTDKWPGGHEAEGLPKDGYILMSVHGIRLKGAARLCGLPTPPYRWDGVGTRHLAGLAASWALRLFPVAVIIRSDSGKIHGLCPNHGRISVLRNAAADN